MGTLYVARRPQRQFIVVKRGENHAGLIVPFYGLDRSEMDFQLRNSLGKRGLSDKDTENAVDQAELESEERQKVLEAKMALRKYMNEKADHSSLRMISNGNKKWALASLRPHYTR